MTHYHIVKTIQQLCPLTHKYPICDIVVTNLREIKNESLEKDVIVNIRVDILPFNIVGNAAKTIKGPNINNSVNH